MTFLLFVVQFKLQIMFDCDLYKIIWWGKWCWGFSL